MATRPSKRRFDHCVEELRRALAAEALTALDTVAQLERTAAASELVAAQPHTTGDHRVKTIKTVRHIALGCCLLGCVCALVALLLHFATAPKVDSRGFLVLFAPAFLINAFLFLAFSHRVPRLQCWRCIGLHACFLMGVIGSLAGVCYLAQELGEYRIELFWSVSATLVIQAFAPIWRKWGDKLL